MEDIELRTLPIHGVNTKISLDFSSYTQRALDQDLKELQEYQQLQGQRKAEDNDLKRVEPLLLTNVFPKNISIDEFKKKSADFFSQTMFHLFKEQTNLNITSTREFELHIKILRIPNRAFYFEYNNNESDDGLASFNGAGIWFLQTIVLPTYMSARIDYAIIARYFAHELVHHQDNMRGFLNLENKYLRKIKFIAKEKDRYALNYLYTSLANLRTEGLADFNARSNSDYQEINNEGIHAYHENLKTLCAMQSKWKMTRFYVKTIGWENLTPSGEYSNGRVMCVTIALWLATLSKKEYFIRIGDVTITLQDILQKKYRMNKLFSKQQIIRVSLSKEAFADAYTAISAVQSDKFIAYYEDACNYFRITEKDRVMTREQYAALVKTIEVAVKK